MKIKGNEAKALRAIADAIDSMTKREKSKEWKVDDWAYSADTCGNSLVFVVDDIDLDGGYLIKPDGYRHKISECRHVLHLQIEREECICGKTH